ncbi:MULTISPECIES: AI-2E family transporter [unclassified Microbacterium]|uniref:AI-2E family transporter n=1 Tax=unclassified Microbacterium TaxID=2609290 RepID=UPI003019ACB9
MALGVLVAVGLALTFASLGAVALSVFLGLFLALGLLPLINLLGRHGLSRTASLTLVVTAVVLVFAAIILFIIPPLVAELVHAVHNAPAQIGQLGATAWVQEIREIWGIDVHAIIGDLVRSLADLTSLVAIAGGLLKIGTGAIGAVSSTVIVMVLTVYFVSALEPMKQALTQIVPAYRRVQFGELVDQITSLVGRVVSGGITVAAINAVVVFILQFAIGSSIALLLAIGAFFITIVPLIGSLVFLVIGTTAALFVSPWAALVFGVLYLGFIQVEAYYTTPRIMGRAVAVPGILVIIGAMVGAALMGLLGALVAIPVTASVLIVVRQVVVPRQDARTSAS